MPQVPLPSSLTLLLPSLRQNCVPLWDQQYPVTDTEVIFTFFSCCCLISIFFLRFI